MTRLPPQSNSAFFPALLAVLSHELGSPLAAIRGAATTLIDYRHQSPDEEVDGFLQAIDRQAARLNTLHEDLVRLAQIAAGLLHPRAEPFDLHPMLVHSLEDLPSDQPGRFVLEGAEVQVLADAVCLRRAFTLLMHHLGDRAVTLTVIRFEATQTHVTVHFPAAEPELADPLARLDQVIRSTDWTRNKQAVVWLKLALSQALIEAQGGQWTWVGTGEQPNLILTLPGLPSEPNSGGH